MANNRQNRWVNGALPIRKVNELLTVYIQGLGRIDCKLVENEKAYLSFRRDNPTLTDSNASEFGKMTIQRNDDTVLAQLWVMGCYEILRTLDEWIRIERKMNNTETAKTANDAKKVFERVRIPLTKLKKPRRRGKPRFGNRITRFF